MSAQSLDTDKTKPEDTDFRQQRLRSWQPLLTPRWVIIFFFLIALVFIPIGVIVLTASEDITEIEYRYDTKACDDSGLDGNVDSCAKTVELTVPRNMDGPVYFYYKLTNFFQNHRRYVQSRSDPQLAGESGGTATCDPLENFGGQLLYPCGLVANSVFSDVITASITYQSNSTTAPLERGHWDRSKIAWEQDEKTKFKDLYAPVTATPLPAGLTRTGPSGTIPPLNDPDLMVWMRPAGTSTFRKLYRKMDMPLRRGDKLTITVADNFKVRQFSGSKSLVISTVGWAGGKNYFLAWAYIVTGIVAGIFSLFFAVKQVVRPRPLGELKAI